jgi:hypothetical protein
MVVAEPPAASHVERLPPSLPRDGGTSPGGDECRSLGDA